MPAQLTSPRSAPNAPIAASSASPTWASSVTSPAQEARGGADLLGELGALRARQVVDRDARAARGERAGGGLAEPRGAAGDEDARSLDLHRVSGNRDSGGRIRVGRRAHLMASSLAFGYAATQLASRPRIVLEHRCEPGRERLALGSERRAVERHERARAAYGVDHRDAARGKRSRRERSRRRSAGSRSLAISSAMPATAPRSAGGVQSAPSAPSATTLVRAPSTSRPPRRRAAPPRRPPRARRRTRARWSSRWVSLGPPASERARVGERRGHRAPRGRVVAELARHAYHVQRAVAVARELEPHDALAAENAAARELAERAPQEPRVDGRQPERARVAQQAPHVPRRRSAARPRGSARVV